MVEVEPEVIPTEQLMKPFTTETEMKGFPGIMIVMVTIYPEAGTLQTKTTLIHAPVGGTNKLFHNIPQL